MDGLGIDYMVDHELLHDKYADRCYAYAHVGKEVRPASVPRTLVVLSSIWCDWPSLEKVDSMI